MSSRRTAHRPPARPIEVAEDPMYIGLGTLLIIIILVLIFL
ncbi:MAG: hypothetical protein ACOCT8_00155 [Actinomycetota bacterium]